MTTHERPPAVKDDPRQIRIDLEAAYRLIHRLGLDDSIYTHISVRLPGRHDRFLINPYGLRFEKATASNLVTVDLDGNIVEDPLGLGINPAGFTIHSAVHAARHDAICAPQCDLADRRHLGGGPGQPALLEAFHLLAR